ncbi:MAG: Acetate kinase, partial [Gammaproteobacteria bacterium]|nr:Acetate kinase [Gammaproteobacteria bacterium]
MPIVLTINGGSSSIRFAFYDAGDSATKLLDGKIDRIGMRDTALTVHEPGDGRSSTTAVSDAADHRSAAAFLMDWLGSHRLFGAIGAVGHRVVHGMKHSRPERITPQLVAELKQIIPYDPEHLPREIELIEALSRAHPEWPQVACFDTAFHRTMPRIATLLPIPRRYEAKGVQRYGFHGLSYTYLMSELRRLGDPAAASGRVILAHLGNGASLAAVLGGKCVDTSMGFTPAAGLVMSTRSGDLDPGIAAFLA